MCVCVDSSTPEVWGKVPGARDMGPVSAQQPLATCVHGPEARSAEGVSQHGVLRSFFYLLQAQNPVHPLSISAAQAVRAGKARHCRLQLKIALQRSAD